MPTDPVTRPAPDDPGAEPAPDLVELTLGAAIGDTQTTLQTGEARRRLPHGVSTHRSQTHVDDRGWLVEMFDPRWGWHDQPVITAHATTVRPGCAKGWAVHREHEDRDFLLLGAVELALYDVRSDSPTRGQVCRLVLSEYDRGSINIPAYVWHGLRNVGDRDVVMVNFPTVPFDHTNPDKYRLPMDTPLIPYHFEGAPGW